MRGRETQSTLPAPTGPEDDRFVYHLTEVGRKVLAEQQPRPS